MEDWEEKGIRDRVLIVMEDWEEKAMRDQVVIVMEDWEEKGVWSSGGRNGKLR